MKPDLNMIVGIWTPVFILTCVKDGEYGAGKTCTMEHVMHYCGTQGWVVAHVPWGKL